MVAKTKILKTVLRATIITILFAILTLMLLQILARFVFSTPVPWAEELGRYGYVWLVFVGSVLLATERSLLTVRIFSEKIPETAQRGMEVFSLALVAVSCFALAFGSFGWMVNVSAGSSPALGVPNDLLYGVVWMSLLLIGAFSALNAILVASRKQTIQPSSGIKDESTGG